MLGCQSIANNYWILLDYLASVQLVINFISTRWQAKSCISSKEFLKPFHQSHWWKWDLISQMAEEACHHRVGIHDITIWIIWGTSADYRLHVYTFLSTHLSSPFSFHLVWGGVRNVGGGTERFRNLLCHMWYIPLAITHLRDCFPAFPRLSGTQDRAGIQDCFILCCDSGIMPFGSWTVQPAWNQIVKWLICFELSFFSFLLPIFPFPFFLGPRAFMLFSVCPVFPRARIHSGVFF